MNYKQKYLKYKEKYINLKSIQYGGEIIEFNGTWSKNQHGFIFKNKTFGDVEIISDGCWETVKTNNNNKQFIYVDYVNTDILKLYNWESQSEWIHTKDGNYNCRGTMELLDIDYRYAPDRQKTSNILFNILQRTSEKNIDFNKIKLESEKININELFELFYYTENIKILYYRSKIHQP